MAAHQLRGWGSVWVKTLAAFPLMFSLLSCNSRQPFPTIKADAPNWLQSTTPKILTATVYHPDLAGWDILAPRVLYNPGPSGSQPTRTGDASIGPNGSLSFTIPDDQNGDFAAFTTISFKWTVSFRLHNGGQDQIDAQTEPQSATLGCLQNDRGRTSPLDNVDRPGRLMVLNPCAMFSGTVVIPRPLQDLPEAPTQDGDSHIEIRPDPGFETFLQPANLGKMVAEIVPADKPSCTSGPVVPPWNPDPISAFGRCTHANIDDPPLGTHVTITGPLVTDSGHGGWGEIHPIWAIDFSPSPVPTPPPFPTPPPLPAPSRKRAH